MDHLFLPTDAVKPPFRVPVFSECLPTCSLRACSFYDFPFHYLRASRDDSTHPDVPGPQPIVSFLQHWLYFRVVAEFFGKDVDVSTFSKIDQSGVSILDTAHLRRLREEWTTSQNPLPGDERERSGAGRITLLVSALHALEQFEKSTVSAEGLRETLFSIRILLASLTITVQAVTTRSTGLQTILKRLTFKNPNPFALPESIGAHFLFRDHMISNGWW